jgi:ribosomal protein S18 acetylase RimI-like enzyme
MALEVRRLAPDDLPRLRQFWVEHWGADFMVAHGDIYRPEQLHGFVIEESAEWIGLVTFIIKDHEMEVTSLDSLREGKGIGTTLIDKVLEEARAKECQRLFLITTNDNLNALGFYQRRGFELSKLYRGAINESRKIKPGIPLIGENNIPLRDEIELEMSLRGRL